MLGYRTRIEFDTTPINVIYTPIPFGGGYVAIRRRTLKKTLIHVQVKIRQNPTAHEQRYTVRLYERVTQE